jgi:tRNA threonylcarbamoyladenosine biosynthesis protein TsaB
MRGVADELLLAVETSCARGSVALARGEEIVAARPLAAERRQAAELFPTIREQLREVGVRLADVRLFAFSRGPGSFTGLRLAATVGRMLHSATGCRVVGVPTLEVIAQNALQLREPPERLVVILDAKRGQVFGGVFERSGDRWATVVGTGLFNAAAWLAGIEKPFAVAGEGIARHAEAVAASGAAVLDERFWTPRAEQVAVLGRRLACAGQWCRPEGILPLYLRPPECEEVYEQRRAEARRRRAK